MFQIVYVIAFALYMRSFDQPFEQLRQNVTIPHLLYAINFNHPDNCHDPGAIASSRSTAVADFCNDSHHWLNWRRLGWSGWSDESFLECL
jgi:hypothetical protein